MNKSMNHKLVVAGDIHLQSHEPKRSNAIDTLNWIFNNKDLNNENNSILFLGDLCEINSPFELFGVFVDYFTNKSKFAKIYLLQGNHDLANQSTILSLFRPLPNVEVIADWKTIKFYNCNLIMLPHFNHEGTNKVSMIELYSNLYKTVTEEFDFGFSHVEDETEHFSKRFADVSKLNVKKWLNGHIHNGNAWDGGHYLGSACMNSVAESGVDKKIAIIDGETKECELIEVPKYLEYYTIEYGKPLPKIDTKYGIFIIINSIVNKNEAISHYEQEAEKLGYKFYCRKVLTKKLKSVEFDEIENASEKPTFEQFAKSVGLSDSILDICKEVINLKEN